MEFERRLRDRHKWSIGDTCSVSRVLDLLSTKTVFLVVRECFYGTTRFEDFMKRVHDEYRLTEASENLLPVFLSLMQWGDKYLQNGQAPLSFVDADNGRMLGVRVTADIDEPATRSDDIEIRFNTPSRHRSSLLHRQ